MAFKKSHLATVQADAEKHGFQVRVNMVSRTADVPVHGAYGDADQLLREAANQLEIVYPPIFFLSRGDNIVSVHAYNWPSALAKAKELSKS